MGHLIISWFIATTLLLYVDLLWVDQYFDSRLYSFKRRVSSFLKAAILHSFVLIGRGHLPRLFYCIHTESNRQCEDNTVRSDPVCFAIWE